MSFHGVPVIYGINTKSTETTPSHQLGALGVTSDGRKFRYCQVAGTDIAIGKLCIAADISTQHEGLAVNTAAIGDKSLTITLGSTAIVGNEYQEGLVMVTNDTGEGETYTIKSAPPTALSTDVVVTLIEPIRVAFAAGTTVTLVRNKFRDVLISDGALANLPVGVTPVAAAASEFFWIQTGGYAAVQNDATTTVVAGQPVTIGDVTSGAVEVINAATEMYVGVVPAGVVGATEEHITVELTLD